MSPPRTRGSTCDIFAAGFRLVVSPAHAGIDPVLDPFMGSGTSLPRARGDRPFADCGAGHRRGSPPRTRGSTPSVSPPITSALVSPAHAGIDPCQPSARACFFSLPRARGDRPWYAVKNMPVVLSPPRTRGSTRLGRFVSGPLHVSPAHAGIDPPDWHVDFHGHSLPRARGDRPCAAQIRRGYRWSPPRTRGSTHRWLSHAGRGRVSPAHAGIDPRDFPTRGKH